VDGLRGCEIFRQEVRLNRALAALSNVELITRCFPAISNSPLSAFSSEFINGGRRKRVFVQIGRRGTARPNCPEGGPWIEQFTHRLQRAGSVWEIDSVQFDLAHGAKTAVLRASIL
jgi:hypothetical protein